MTRPLHGAPRRVCPPCSVDPIGIAAVSGGYGWRSGRRARAVRTGPGRSGGDAARSGREKMVRTTTVQAKTYRPARNARRDILLDPCAATLIAISTCLSGSAAFFPNRASSCPGALRRLAGRDLRIPSPDIALAPFAASPPSTRTGRGSVPLDRRDGEAGSGPTSFTWPTKCLSTHPIPRRPGLWCCAGTA